MKLILYQATMAITEIDFVPGPFRCQIELGHLRPTPANREIVFHSESGICTIVSQRCFTTRNLRTKLCGIRSQTQKQQFVDPFKSWYLETRSDPEMENRRACGNPFCHKGLN